MSARSSGDTSGGPRQPQASPLRCNECGTDRDLAIRSIEALRPASETLVEVAYTCTTCGLFYAHPADVTQVAVILNRPGRTPGVLVFGGHYIHCGQPMEKAGAELRGLHTPVTTDQTTGDPLGVYLSTRVLRCACGFQIELPE
jgi:hypothetical protein